jgi:DNA modification methylase
MKVTIHCGDALAELRKLPSNSFDCCVDGQLGLDPTPEI